MRDIAFALIMLGLIPLAAIRPYIGLLVWSWLGYMNPHRLTFGFAYSFPWVMLVAAVTLLSLGVGKENKRIPRSTVSVLLMMFLLWTGLTTFFAVLPDAAWVSWQTFAKIMVMVFVTLMLINSRERMHWLIWVIVISLGYYGLKGGLFTITSGGGNRVFGPAGSFIGDNNDLAQALCMVLPLMRYLQLQSSRKMVKVGLGLAMFLTGVAILGTYSRGGFIALAVVSAALLLKSRKRLTLAIALMAIGLTAYHFMPPEWSARMDTIHHAEDVNTMQSRIQSWEFAANVALHRPLTGGGFKVYESEALWNRYAPEDAVQRAVHSIYFRVLGEQGFPGLAIFIGLLVASWRSCAYVRNKSRHLPNEKWAFDLSSMLQISLLAFMVAGLATTSSYFDLSYQLMAMCALLKGLLPERVAAYAGSAGAAATQPHLLGRGQAGHSFGKP
ncbi:MULTISPECIES: putative O-glycosylation ligase, exosortase A system-associated [Rhodanobacter]|uniref:putative O-glycosylation ligase, exosortase A system-associated n=1 Tax=Rhodanobacter TaxID=75309 RepID=UPI0004189A18|nr:MULTISPECIES: putative O-glycosylation ligase, exosortase A system-associated [Rhodanobacter]TAN16811.1 MAG: putative O-glycosylation ligase, exosortase A system-associated [Rhodanobacter sp.]UJJ54316.1 putative O-glycosylation ligase, exosortase A system-associated [Rhodanobacter thiooxydans]